LTDVFLKPEWEKQAIKNQLIFHHY